MDALDHLILTERAALDALRMQVAGQEAKVAALLEAASLRPTSSGKKIGTVSRGGKPKGAISAPWKNTLAELHKTQKAWPYWQIKACYDHTNGAELPLASVRDRVRSLVENRLMVGSSDEGFSVTEYAAKKFGFGKPEKAPNADASEAPQEFGRVAELEGPEKTEQHPNGNGENVGSSPTPPSPIQTGGGFADDLDDDIPF